MTAVVFQCDSLFCLCRYFLLFPADLQETSIWRGEGYTARPSWSSGVAHTMHVEREGKDKTGNKHNSVVYD